MRQLGELVWVEDGTVVSARVRVADVRVEAWFRRRVQRTIARLEDETGTHRRDLVRAALHRAPAARRAPRSSCRGKVKHFGRKLTLDNPEFQAVGGDDELLHAGRIVPVYRLTAGLTAVRLRIGDPRGARPGRLRLPGVPAGRDPRGRGGSSPIARALEEAHYPASFEGRDAALRRLAFDELLALQLGHGRAAAAARAGRGAGRSPSTDAADAALRAALVGALGAKARPRRSS